MKTTIKPTTSFWVISIIAFIWNALGVMAYLGQAFITDDMKTAIPQEQLTIIENTPAWATAAFAVAVWAGIIGSILLLMRKKIAKNLFIISLAGVAIQFIYNFFIANAMEAYGTSGLIMPALTIGFGLFLIFFAIKQTIKGVLS